MEASPMLMMILMLWSTTHCLPTHRNIVNSGTITLEGIIDSDSLTNSANTPYNAPSSRLSRQLNTVLGFIAPVYVPNQNINAYGLISASSPLISYTPSIGGVQVPFLRPPTLLSTPISFLPFEEVNILHSVPLNINQSTSGNVLENITLPYQPLEGDLNSLICQSRILGNCARGNSPLTTIENVVRCLLTIVNKYKKIDDIVRGTSSNEIPDNIDSNKGLPDDTINSSSGNLTVDLCPLGQTCEVTDDMITVSLDSSSDDPAESPCPECGKSQAAAPSKCGPNESEQYGRCRMVF